MEWSLFATILLQVVIVLILLFFVSAAVSAVVDSHRKVAPADQTQTQAARAVAGSTPP